MIKSNYDKLYQVLRAWYTPDQIDEIWDMLKKYDNLGPHYFKGSKPSSSQAGGPAHKESGFKQLKLTSDKLIGYYKTHK